MSGVGAAPGSNREPNRWRLVLTLAVFAALLGCVAHTIWFWIRTITFPFPVDYGEGPLLDQAVRLGRGLGIYIIPAAEPPWSVANYPPLFPLLNSLWAQLFGPAYWYGRLTSSLSALAAGLFAGLIVLAITRARLAAGITALLLLAIPYVGYWAGFARIDTLSLMLSLAGLWCVVRRPTSTVGLGAAVILLAAAGFTRQTYLLAGPLAAVIWLWPTGRRRALGFAGALLATVLADRPCDEPRDSGGFWFDVVTANVNEYSLDNLTWYIVDVGRRVPILLAVLVAYAVIALRDRPRVRRG